MRLFNRKGYRDTTMEEIATAVGMPDVGDLPVLLRQERHPAAAIYRRAADRLSSEASSILGAVDRSGGGADRLDRRLREEIVRPPGTCLRLLHRTGEHGARGPEDPARTCRRSTVESWVELVMAVRPEWTAGHARFAVHAAMALVIDMGRLMHYDNTRSPRRRSAACST